MTGETRVPELERERPRRIAVVTNTEWNMLRFRSDLLDRLVADGWSVAALCDLTPAGADALRRRGVTPVRVSVSPAGLDPFDDLRYLAALARAYARLRPDVVHHFSIKPVVWGSFAARIARVPRVVNGVTGLGSAYDSERRWLAWLVRSLYRMALRRGIVVLQNHDDRERLLADVALDPARAEVVPGSGVDTERLRPDPDVAPETRSGFIMVSRMLWAKGVREFVEAARRVRAARPGARFSLFGGCREDYGSKNSDFVPRDWLEAVDREGIVRWHGRTGPEEVERCMRSCAALVHPSDYPEGVPRTLLEAASAGAPIVTTDRPGCRDAVLPGRSGLLVPPRSVDALADAMLQLHDDPALRARMGAAGRRLAETRFDSRLVVARFLSFYDRPEALTAGDASIRRADLAR